MFVLGLVIVVYAQGYRINPKNLKIIKTGILFVSSNQKVADVYVNGKVVSQKMPYATNLLPGTYSVLIKKDGYASWSAMSDVKQELVTSYKTIVLFKESIVSQELTDEKKIALLSVPTDILAVNAEKALVYNEHEIWTNDTLVTRFSKPITKAMWYPDLDHIIYQQGQEIRVIEKNGVNDTLLVRLANDQPTVFTIGNHGEELYYLDNGVYRFATIR